MEIWEIVLLVWICAIPAAVLGLTAVVARRRRPLRLPRGDSALDQPGQLLRFAPHARELQHVRRHDDPQQAA